MQAFGIAVLTGQQQGPRFGSAEVGYFGCPLRVMGRPESITLRIEDGKNGLTPLAIYDGKPYEGERLDFQLTVPVSWMEQGSLWIPRTRSRWDERDFVDILLINTQLHFVDVQVSLLSRKGRFYTMAQRVYDGWMRIVNEEACFIPAHPFYAYPGADYRATWKDKGSVLATMARVVHEILSTIGDGLDKVVAAKWEPREIPVLEGWRRGHVLFFNPITNTGHVLGEDGTIYHVYGNNLVGIEGPIHMLSPMAPVYFRPGKQEEGQAFPSVKSCKPA